MTTSELSRSYQLPQMNSGQNVSAFPDLNQLGTYVAGDPRRQTSLMAEDG